MSGQWFDQQVNAMNEHEHIRKKKPDQANIRLAIILALVALMLAMMPFFYLTDMVVPY